MCLRLELWGTGLLRGCWSNSLVVLARADVRLQLELRVAVILAAPALRGEPEPLSGEPVRRQDIIYAICVRVPLFYMAMWGSID